MTSIPASDRVVTASDNAPPDPLTPIRERVDLLIANTNLWMKTTERQAAGEPIRREIMTPEEAQKLEDFFDQIRKEIKKLETDRKAINKPFEDAVKANNNAFRPFSSALTAIQSILEPIRTLWYKKEEDRLAAEALEKARIAAEEKRRAEEAKRAAEAAATVEDIIVADEAEERAEEAAKVAEAAQEARPQVRGEYTQRAGSLRTFWTAKITDYPKALAHYANDPKVVDAVQLLANADARANKNDLAVPGVVAVSEERAV